MMILSRRHILVGLACAALAPNSALAQTDYPVTVEHAFGVTTLEAKPERVVTVNWANHEVPLALGVVPLGMAAANFGDDDDDGVLPWVTQRLEELGAETPTLFDEGDGYDFEAIAALQPDVILGAYSGMSAQDYAILSQIAPTVAYPDAPWTTSWRDMIRLNSAGLGMVAEGEALIADLDRQISAAAASRPAIAGKNAVFVTHLDPTNLSRVRFYTDNDTRVAFLHDLGLTSPEAVRDVSAEGRFAGEISAERIDMLDDVDIIVTYGTPALVETLRGYTLTRQMPAIDNNAIVLLQNDPLGTAASPTPLAIPYILDDYVDMLAKAAARAE